MSRRSTPDRLHAARRTGLCNRMVGEFRMSAEAAERWLRAWEERCDLAGVERGNPDYWKDAAAWILTRHRGG